MSGISRFVPPQVAAAAAPLHRVADLLEDLRTAHSLLLTLTEGSPSPAARAALHELVDRWYDAAWRLSRTAEALAAQLEHSADLYARTEASLATELTS